MSTLELPPGIYHIVVGVISPFADSRLTRQENNNNGVTILPPSIEPDPKQEWRIVLDQASGTYTIEDPAEIRFSLAYKGDIDRPREGDKIVATLDTPEQKWRLGAAPGRYNTLQVGGAESLLSISISPLYHEPPILELGEEDKVAWSFQRVDVE